MRRFQCILAELRSLPMNTFHVLVASLALTTASFAQTCTATTVGTGCGGTLNIQFTPQGGAGNQRIDITATGLLPNTHGIMIWGVTPTSIPIGNCSILTEFVWGHTILANGAGQYDWSRSWPASVMPGFYYIQIGNFGFDQNNNFVLVGTEAKLAQCQ